MAVACNGSERGSELPWKGLPSTCLSATVPPDRRKGEGNCHRQQIRRQHHWGKVFPSPSLHATQLREREVDHQRKGFPSPSLLAACKMESPGKTYLFSLSPDYVAWGSPGRKCISSPAGSMFFLWVQLSHTRGYARKLEAVTL